MIDGFETRNLGGGFIVAHRTALLIGAVLQQFREFLGKRVRSPVLADDSAFSHLGAFSFSLTSSG
jgi:hypothetical protein